METSFSIVMPNYNSLYLKRAIKSVINQTHKNWELIIVDNNSNNFPEKTIKEFKNEKISFFKYENNNIIAKSRNFAIKKAKYDWIAFLDSDDVWKKNKLSLVQKKIDKEKPDFVYHGMYYLPKMFGFIKRIIKGKSLDMIKPIFNSLIEKGNSIANSSVVVKKSLLIDVGLQSESKKKVSWEDYDCWIKCAKKTDSFLYIPKILGYCWVGGGNVSSFEQTKINFQNFHDFYKKEIITITKKKRLDWYNNFLLIWYYKTKNFERAYILDKKINKNELKSLLRSILIKLLFFKKIFTKCIFKNLKINND